MQKDIEDTWIIDSGLDCIVQSESVRCCLVVEFSIDFFSQAL